MRVQSTHSRAFTMLDDEEKAQMEAAMKEDSEKAAVRASQPRQESPAPETAARRPCRGSAFAAAAGEA